MKELSIEEKAHRYDEAIKEATIAYKDEDKHLKATLERIFPELKESEEEQSKKWILEYLHDGLRKSDEQFKGQFKCAIAWLEKQGEQMSDPRYSILDKLIEADDIYQMSVNDAMIEEAKNKAIEVLSKLEISKLLELEKQGEKKPAWGEEDERMYRGLHNLIYSTPYCDSRKELSNFLNSLKNRVQPQQEWSEEDKYNLSDIEAIIHTIKGDGLNADKLINWVKSLKDRVQPQPNR